MTQPSQHISHFLIGIPASGKSTFARWLQQETQGQIICPDHIRAQLYGDAAIQGDWSELAVVIEAQIQRAIASQTTIIYDATNFQQTWRQNFLAQYSYLNWLGWYLQTPFEDCIQRNHHRSRTVPPEIMQWMFRELQTNPPRVTDGLDQLIYVQSGDRLELKALKKQHLPHLGD